MLSKEAPWKAQNDQLTQQNAATAQKSNEAQQALDALKARDARQESAKAEALALHQRVLSGVPGILKREEVEVVGLSVSQMKPGECRTTSQKEAVFSLEKGSQEILL